MVAAVLAHAGWAVGGAHVDVVETEGVAEVGTVVTVEEVHMIASAGKAAVAVVVALMGRLECLRNPGGCIQLAEGLVAVVCVDLAGSHRPMFVAQQDSLTGHGCTLGRNPCPWQPSLPVGIEFVVQMVDGRSLSATLGSHRNLTSSTMCVLHRPTPPMIACVVDIVGLCHTSICRVDPAFLAPVEPQKRVRQQARGAASQVDLFEVSWGTSGPLAVEPTALFWSS